MKRITDLEEILRLQEERGITPMRVDDAMPVYDVEVSCGLPKGVGDVRMEFMSSPAMIRAMGAQYCVTATGDSMADADIEDGDVLWIDSRAEIHDGDIVLAFWDGKSKGTKYAIDYAEKMGKPVRVIKI